jgi:hypothetical protein
MGPQLSSQLEPPDGNDVRVWFSAGGEGNLQAPLVGAEERRNAPRVDGCRESEISRAWFSVKALTMRTVPRVAGREPKLKGVGCLPAGGDMVATQL